MAVLGPVLSMMGAKTVYICVLLLVLCTFVKSTVSSKTNGKLLVITVATEETDGFKRFMRSARVYGLRVEVLGMNEQWEGGDVRLYSGGGHKVNLLQNEMKKYWEQKDLIVMFVDSYDVIFMASPEDILKKFYKTKAKVLFSAEGYCWPDSSLTEKYPKVEKGKRFLNSGGFIFEEPTVNSADISSLELGFYKDLKTGLYICVHCSYSTHQKGHMTDHLRRHTGEKPFKCHFCGKGFTRKDSLKSHINIHTAIKPFKCRHCTFRSSNRGSIHRHETVYHQRRLEKNILIKRFLNGI